MFKKLTEKVLSGIEVREAKDMLARLQSLDSPEVALVTAMVYHSGAILERDLGLDPFHPAILVELDPDAPLKTSKLAISLRKENEVAMSNALAVWVHTFRAMRNYQVRNISREIWKCLASGIPHVEKVDNQYFMETRKRLALSRLGQIPEGVHFERP